MLKATRCIWIGLTLVGMSLAVAKSQAGQLSTTVGWVASQAVVAQTGSADKRTQADDLLRRARQALAENDFEAAEQLAAQAERLGVSYGPMPLGDTPERVRRDIELKRTATSRRTGSVLPLPFRRSEQEPMDPFTARNREDARGVQPAGGEESMSMLPPVDQVNSVPPPSGGAPLARPGMGSAGGYEPAGRGGDRARSDELLIAARRALALGDVRRASQLVQQTRELNVRYSPNEDSPARVEMAIRQYEDLMQQPQERRQSEAFRRQYAKVLLEQAEALAAWQQYSEAERLAMEASRLGVSYGPFDARPETLLRQIEQARRQQRYPVQPAGGQFPVSQAGGPYEDQRANQALYDPRQDSTRNVWAGATTGAPAGSEGSNSVGVALLRQAEEALRNRDNETAIRLFREAAKYEHEMDPVSRQRLQEYMPLFTRTTPPGGGMIDEAMARQQALLRQVHAEVAQQESAALKLRETDPRGALAVLTETRKRIEAAQGLDPNARAQLLRRIDRDIELTRKYVEENRSRIELEEQNTRVEEDLARSQMTKLEIQQKLAAMVDEYNRLMDEQRFAEAEVMAKRAYQLDPDSPVTMQLMTQSKFVRRYFNNLRIQEEKERSFADRLAEVDASLAIPVGDRNPLVFPDAKEWAQLTKSRSKYLADRRRGMSERELEIERKLKTPVTLDFKNAPLSTVMEYLAKLADVNLHLDPQGLAEEGVTTDTPVTVSLTHEVSLKSALNLILQPLHLSYVIKDEVLKITSEQARSGEVYTVSYPVADLVIPIPNFTPNPRMGLAGAYHDALGAVGYGGMPAWAGGAGAPLAVVASREGAPNTAMVSPAILAQMQQATGGAAGAASAGPRTGAPLMFGPGGLGGGVQADFDSLIDLITSTVRPNSWTDLGGPGSIASFPVNLSIVVSQTQEVHEEIVDLLEQLRRLQDLQVTIEVRFITLMDNFFERIGVDFDFDINDNNDRPYQIFGRRDPTVSTQYTNQTYEQDYPRNTQDRDLKRNQSTVAGLNTAGAGINLGNFSADLDIPFRQDSFALTIPQFGGFPAGSNPGAQIGFAILSEIEAFFFIQAAQGDTRTNILQAPKVTLFNGQQAFVSDTSQSPFVISVIPVVGDFAAAQQPVIVVLNEGTFLTVQAVVSNDRRFVRLTVVPFFSKIDEVNTFTFTGSETSSEESSSEGNQETPNDNTKKSSSKTVRREGTTVQLPTFSFVTVTTTVSVPDGGTVLLGGIKRLSEQRREFGVPMLNKIPYVNRLFKNVGIGRDSSSLMMMVTPRIIIQEEEEERLGILP